MKTVSSKIMRQIDRCAIEDYGVSGEDLMDRAGREVADAVSLLFDRCERSAPSVLLIAGRGNNGGDAFAAARYLRQYGFDVTVWLAGSLGEIEGDSRGHLERMQKSKIQIEEFPTKEDWDEMTADFKDFPESCANVLVDGVLGTGIKGPARGPAAGAISYINMMTKESFVVAIDVPSGLNADTGRVEGDAVVADITVTMGMPKRGLLEPSASEYTGRLMVADIGIPKCLTENLESDVELITKFDIRPLFPKRRRSSHKGDYGHLCILGGATGYSGAVSLAARAALRSGVGLVTVVVPESIAAIVASNVPEAMVYGAVETECGSLASAGLQVWREKLNACSAVLVGPGMTRHSDTEFFVDLIVRECSAPLVMDADALNAFEGRCEELRSLRKAACPLVLTPHPGEMARLMGKSIKDIQDDRFAAAMEAADKTGAVIVLKGTGTLVAQSGRVLNVNMTGNPGMATGGIGDVLAGLLGGVLAQGFSSFDAARTAVLVHGLAGDDASHSVGEISMTASDVIASISRAFFHLSVK